MPASLRCEIFPSDLDATVDFYVQVLAFRLVRDERASGHPYVALERGDVKLGAAARTEVPDRDQRRPPTGVELVLEVDSLEADRERVAQAGWPVVEDVTHRPWGLSDFRLLDPSGCYWRITEASSTPRTPSR
ncbi:MAG TPA: VOC family protein [Solirubrobacteraceae bacterium]